MGYGSKSLNDWRDDALRIANEHGFKDASVGEDIALMHSELSEALEEYRSASSLNANYYVNFDMQVTDKQVYEGPIPQFKPLGVPSEMADVIIRVLHFCGKHGIDIEQAVREKMDYNETRPFKHGNKRI